MKYLKRRVLRYTLICALSSYTINKTQFLLFRNGNQATNCIHIRTVEQRVLNPVSWARCSGSTCCCCCCCWSLLCAQNCELHFAQIRSDAHTHKHKPKTHIYLFWENCFKMKLQVNKICYCDSRQPHTASAHFSCVYVENCI